MKRVRHGAILCLHYFWACWLSEQHLETSYWSTEKETFHVPCALVSELSSSVVQFHQIPGEPGASHARTKEGEAGGPRGRMLKKVATQGDCCLKTALEQVCQPRETEAPQWVIDAFWNRSITPILHGLHWRPYVFLAQTSLTSKNKKENIALGMAQNATGSGVRNS